MAGKKLEGRTTNVSRGGLCADLVEAITPGADIEIDMKLVFDDASVSEPLRVQARVAWCTEVEETFQIGVAFKPLPPERMKYLTMFLQYLDTGERVATKRAATIDDQFG